MSALELVRKYNLKMEQSDQESEINFRITTGLNNPMTNPISLPF
tara:strand:- start:646 stop:777 length:132 start_codon:yes stop_codon:yes gene_type:complete